MAGTIHETLTGDLLHVPGYVSGSDPGAVGPGKLWVDISGGVDDYRLRIRNAADDGWEEIGYLPLTAGSGKPLTGDLYISKTGGANVFILPEGVSTDRLTLNVNDGTGGGGTFFASFDVTADSGDVEAAVEARPLDGSSNATVSLFLETNTTGDRIYKIYVGDGSTDIQHSINAGSGNVDLCQQAGVVRIGDVGGNGILLDPVNGIYLYGSAIAWDDLRFPATNLHVNPATLKPDFDYTEVGFLFDAGSTETIFAIAQMPHGYAEGTDIEVHIHWEPTNTNTGNVLWQLEYKWTNIGDTEAGSFTTITVLDAGDGTAYKHQIADFATISGTGKTISSILSLKISRLGGDGTDTYNADALLKEFDIHYQINSFGSDDEYTKGP